MRPKKVKEPGILLQELLQLQLTDRVAIKNELTASIEREVKQKQEAAKEAEQIANGK